MPDEATPFHSTRRGFLTSAVAVGTATAAIGVQPKPGEAPVNPRLFTFVGGAAGAWTVRSSKAVVGDALPAVDRVDFVTGAMAALPDGAKWMLRGATSNDRYVIREEKVQLVKKQAALGREESTHGALIPIRKNAKWWALTQDERRAIFEEQSKHIAVGMKYLPGVARRLHHCRDLDRGEPFDFLTLFDFAKADETAFDDMLTTMRASEEWKYIDREVDIRLIRAK